MHPVLLVVHENRNIREFCKRELERQGYTVLLAEGPSEVLLMLDAMALDLIVTDVLEAPGMKFPDFLRRVGRRDIPVIVHTVDQSYLFGTHFWPVEACVEESADLVDLKREIEKTLRRRARRRAALEDCEPTRSPGSEGRSWDEDDMD
ncbi:MAG: response regulator [Planctomycetota bacterium]|jgi:DNA-binding NtrC family response regulator